MSKINSEPQLLQCGQYIIHVLRAMLHHQPIPTLPAEISWSQVFEFSRQHSLDTMILAGVENQVRSANPDCYAHWQQHRDMTVAQALTQISEEPRLLAAFSHAGLHVLPVKGSSLRKLYPRPDYRQMSDIDLVIPSEELEQASGLLASLGYEQSRKYLEDEHEVIYSLPPFLSVELHDVPSHIEESQRIGYYQGIWAKAESDETLPGVSHLRIEDAYLYLLMHFIKHYEYAGAGIRQVLDFYLFLQAYASEMDQAYLAQETNRLGIKTMRANIEQLAMYCFAAQPIQPSPEVRELQEFCILSGTYGGYLSHRIVIMRHTQQQESGHLLWKLRYLWQRLFPPADILYSRYPSAKGKPWLLPICWFRRLTDKSYWKERFHGEMDSMKQIK